MGNKIMKEKAVLSEMPSFSDNSFLPSSKNILSQNSKEESEKISMIGRSRNRPMLSSSSLDEPEDVMAKLPPLIQLPPSRMSNFNISLEVWPHCFIESRLHEDDNNSKGDMSSEIKEGDDTEILMVDVDPETSHPKDAESEEVEAPSFILFSYLCTCLLYTSDAADE
eukprot:TRINITY_DN4306_c0_g1_i3.p1 TRINITY_DN4306_c0_g1~~TRINITY_DN4306_c0_g1_i3.p1  ORF type:complete len:167 (+),score=13.87 TRINITY_DN4306_c0_g1_i3:42-542(+)